jgi:glutamate N-acetyltransferase/amino-acid N-acetyltransferase
MPFCQVITDACVTLAQAIVRDGEGATKFITIQVEQGRDEAECLAVAYTIAHSPLVKTAFFASDANWGRILAAVGRAGLTDLDINQVHIYLGNVCIVRQGGRAADYAEADGQAVMRESEITVRVLLGRGNSHAQVWTCDLTYDYVKINAEYRT